MVHHWLECCFLYLRGRLRYSFTQWHHPKSSFGALMTSEHNSALIYHSTVYFCEFYITSYPALHNHTTDNMERDARPEMMWPSLAASGSLGSASMHVTVDLTCDPSGNLTMRGLITGCTLVIGASVTKKWLVAPKSNIAHSLMFVMLISTVASRAFAAYLYWLVVLWVFFQKLAFMGY